MVTTSATSLAGKIFPFLSMFIITPGKLMIIASALYNAVNQSDIFVLAVFGWCTLPMAEFVYNEYWATQHKTVPKFQDSPVKIVATKFSQAIRVAGIVLIADFLDITMSALEVPAALDLDFGHIAAAVGYTAWIAYEIAMFKHYLIVQAVSSSEGVMAGRTGESAVVDRLCNLAIGLFAGLFVLDLLEVEMGAGLKSMFALGGAGTLVISLASKDLAEQFLSGVFLHASDKFYEGDFVTLGDGTAGTVSKIGWMHTLIRAGDNSEMRIPNGQLAKLRVSNLSRVEQCQVKQSLHFAFSDMAKMPTLTKDIKQEIQDACPDLITDGSRPFRVHWTDITDDRLKVEINCHFNLPCFGDAYADNRQNVLLAIEKALTKNETALAVPAYNLSSERTPSF